MTEELPEVVVLVRVTFSMAISPTTGAVMVVTIKRPAAASKRKVPTWWKKPVRAILRVDWLFHC